MRILFFAGFFEYKGSETYYTSEIKSIIRNFPNVEFLVYTFNCEKNKITRYSENILYMERKIRFRLNNNFSTLFLFLKDIVKIFTKFKPNVIHSTYTIPSTLMGFIGKIFNIPSIFHALGTDINYLPYKSVIRNVIARIAAKLNDIVLTVSKSMIRDCLNLNIPVKKIVHIYYGIDFDNFFSKKDKDYSLNKKFEILHIGRFSPEKSHDLIIKVCKELKESGENFHLIFIGIGNLMPKIIDQVKKEKLEDKVSFLGWINHNELPNWMDKADLFILPSITEGIPNTALESMSMGLPVILTNVGGMPELIQEKGGILIEKNNYKQLFEGILYYIYNPKEREIGGKINRKFIINNFNWDKHAENLFALYKKIERRRI